MFDFVTVLGSITDILVTEIKVGAAAITGSSGCHYTSLLWVISSISTVEGQHAVIQEVDLVQSGEENCDNGNVEVDMYFICDSLFMQGKLFTLRQVTMMMIKNRKR